MHPNTDTLATLDSLLETLLHILRQEGNTSTRYAEHTLEIMRRNIALAQSLPNGAQQVMPLLKADYRHLFPSKADPFYRWHDSYPQRVRLNREYQQLLEDIQQLLS